jgi:hypothetical protein
MTKTFALLMGTAAVFAMVGTASAAPVTSHAGGKAHAIKNPNRAASVLYDQSNNDGGNAITSQNFESSFDIYDNSGADDFDVPANTKWKVTEVDAFGQYYNGYGPAVSETVTFYKNKKGHPGKVKASFTVTGADSGGSFTIPLGKGVGLSGGTKGVKYWVGVYVNMDFGTGGQWGWESQTTAEGVAANWQNPGDGFGTGCTTWGTENVCIPAGQGDKMFILRGKAK